MHWNMSHSLLINKAHTAGWDNYQGHLMESLPRLRLFRYTGLSHALYWMTQDWVQEKVNHIFSTSVGKLNVPSRFVDGGNRGDRLPSVPAIVTLAYGPQATPCPVRPAQTTARRHNSCPSRLLPGNSSSIDWLELDQFLSSSHVVQNLFFFLLLLPLKILTKFLC